MRSRSREPVSRDGHRRLPAAAIARARLRQRDGPQHRRAAELSEADRRHLAHDRSCPERRKHRGSFGAIVLWVFPAFGPGKERRGYSRPRPRRHLTGRVRDGASRAGAVAKGPRVGDRGAAVTPNVLEARRPSAGRRMATWDHRDQAGRAHWLSGYAAMLWFSLASRPEPGTSSGRCPCRRRPCSRC